jgi:tRNA(Ile)-lysidine synthase TilS/MesJ
VPPWFEALRRYWREEGFDPAGQIFLLAVSGGFDSVALLELFHRIAAPAAGRLFALHVNHGLRPGAIADQAFVENLCRGRGIPLRIETLDPATRGRGQSPEIAPTPGSSRDASPNPQWRVKTNPSPQPDTTNQHQCGCS